MGTAPRPFLRLRLRQGTGAHSAHGGGTQVTGYCVRSIQMSDRRRVWPEGASRLVSLVDQTLEPSPVCFDLFLDAWVVHYSRGAQCVADEVPRTNVGIE